MHWSHSACSWASWHSSLKMLGEVVVLKYKFWVLYLRQAWWKNICIIEKKKITLNIWYGCFSFCLIQWRLKYFLKNRTWILLRDKLLPVSNMASSKSEEMFTSIISNTKWCHSVGLSCNFVRTCLFCFDWQMLLPLFIYQNLADVIAICFVVDVKPLVLFYGQIL